MANKLLKSINDSLTEATSGKHKVVVLLGSLKTDIKESNTYHLCKKIEKATSKSFAFSYIHLAKKTIDIGLTIEADNDQDDMADIYNELKGASVVIVASPIWWGNPSSLIQRVVERLDEADVRCYEDNDSSSLGEGKLLTCVITGGSDGGQNCIARIIGWGSALGFTIAPFSTIYRLGEIDEEGEQAENCYIEQMAKNLIKFADFLR